MDNFLHRPPIIRPVARLHFLPQKQEAPVKDADSKSPILFLTNDLLQFQHFLLLRLAHLFHLFDLIVGKLLDFLQ